MNKSNNEKAFPPEEAIDALICCDCIGEDFLRQEVASSSNSTACDFCDASEEPTIPLDELAERIHSVIEEHYFMTSPEPEGWEYQLAKDGRWEQPGEPAIEIIQSLAMIDLNPAELILKYLSDTYDPKGEDALIEPQLYDSESLYEERPINSYEFAESWASFKNQVGSHARFFNQSAQAILEHIFDGIGALVARESEPVIHEFTERHETNLFYRSRIAESARQLKKILSKLPKSLGPPPPGTARAGRMNAAGISVFYGAMEAETCIAEIRAPVGSSVVTGTFVPTRRLRLLNLGSLKKVFLVGSIFDGSHMENLARIHFLKQLVDEISSPVMPGDEERKYLPTQVVAEFLAAKQDLELDGVIYPSLQVTGGGENIVLFNHASTLETSDLPEEVKVSVLLHTGDPDDPDDSITIREEMPEQKVANSGVFNPTDLVFDFHPSYRRLGQFSDNEPSIRLYLDSIKVQQVTGIGYQTHERHVSRYRITHS